MRSSLLLSALLSTLLGCNGRAAITPDGAAAADGDALHDMDVPTCSTLTVVGQVTLEYADTLKTSPRIAFDGERFAVVWHSQPAMVSSMNGVLRFALVDRTGRSDTAVGVALATDDGSLEAALVATPGEYAVLHRPTGGGALLRRFDATGKTVATASMSGKAYESALALHPSGYAALVAEQAGSPRIIVVDRNGSITPLANIISAEVMSSLWLASRPGGLAAGLGTKNSNGRLHLLDQDGTEVIQTSVGQGTRVGSPSFAVLPAGFAAVYIAGSAKVETAVFDVAGQSVGRHVLGATSTAGPSTRQTALAWSGRQLFAAYPSIGPGRYTLQALDAAGLAEGAAVKLPGCLAVSDSIDMAWGRDQLAVVTLDHASGLPNSGICVTIMGCK